MSITLGELLIKLTAKTDAFQKGMNDAKKLAFDSSADIVSSLGRIGESLGKLKFENLNQVAASLNRVGGIIAGVAVGVATASIAAAEHVALQAKEIDKLSQSYGLSVQQISAFRVASTITGVSLDTITSGMSRLAKNAATVAEAVGGHAQKGAAAAFNALHISVTDSQGKLLPLNDLLGTVAEKFSRMQDSTTKTALAIQIFGKGGAALIPFLNEGKEGLERLRAVSDELGLTWSQADVTAAKEFAETVELLKLKGESLEEQLAKGLFPALNNVASALLKVDSTGNSAAHTLGEGLGEVLKGLAETAEVLGHDFAVLYLTIKQLADPTASPLSVFSNSDNVKSYEDALNSLDQQLKDVYATLEKTHQSILTTFPTQGGDLSGRLSALNQLFGRTGAPPSLLGGNAKIEIDNWKEIADAIKKFDEERKKLILTEREFYDLEKSITKELHDQQGLFSIDLSKNQQAQAPIPGFTPDAYNAASKFAKQIADQLNSLDYTRSLNRAFDELEIRMGGALGGARAFFRQYSEYAKQTGQQVYDALANAFSQLEDTLADFFTTFKANWKALADSIEKEIVKIAIRGLITGPLSTALGKLFGVKSAPKGTQDDPLFVSPVGGSLGVPGIPSTGGTAGAGGVTGGINGIFSKLWESISGIFKNLGSILTKVFSSIGSFFGGLFGGGRASGGPVSAGTLYRVNENHTEWFKPNTNGHILPLGQMAAAGGGGFTFAPTYYISTPNADSFRKSQNQTINEGLDAATRAQRRR